ncbi:MAG: hypothetical protein KAG97_10680, partial [Victivallales bacterium]|nr:hypothetical protein [Victivallales bacterium]
GDHRLTHAERTVLRGILAPLGAEGRDAIHAVLRECDNYSRNLTDKMLAATHSNPMGCARIKEILSYMTQKIGCDCSFRKKQGDYAHPLRHLSKVQTKRSDTSEPAPKVFTRRKSTSDNQNQSRVAESAEIPSDLADGEVHTSADGTPKEKRTIARLKLVLGSFSIDLNFSRKKRESK